MKKSKPHHCAIHKDRAGERCETCHVSLCNDCSLVHGRIAVEHEGKGADRMYMHYEPLIEKLHNEIMELQNRNAAYEQGQKVLR